MGRNSISRHVQFAPAIKGLRPFGRFRGSKKDVILSVDEFEAIRLLDYMHLNQEEASIQMKVSRSTLTRIYEKARVKYATALVEGCNLIIEGGEVNLSQHIYRCNQCNFEINTNEENITKCPQCNSDVISVLEECYTKKCRHCRQCHQGGRHARNGRNRT